MILSMQYHMQSVELSSFISEGNMGRINYSRWISKTKRGRSPPKDSLKLLFNPYKNVGVYAENVWKTIFPIANEKRGRIFKCVLL